MPKLQQCAPTHGLAVTSSTQKLKHADRQVLLHAAPQPFMSILQFGLSYYPSALNSDYN